MNEIVLSVIHEVKNRLAELAFRLEQKEGMRAEVEVALNASRRLSEILMLERDRENALWVNPDSVNPADFLSVLAGEYAALHPALSVFVETGAAPDIAFFDENMVRTALGNALHDACLHAKSTVRLAAFGQEGMLVLEVRDDGPGYPEEVLKGGGAFPSSLNGKGTGLGLYLSARIAALHRVGEQCGRIELSNAEGARFRMLLP